MKFPRWDRIYYFVYFAMLTALASFAALFVVPLVEITDVETGEIFTKTIPANEQWDIVWLSLLPVAITGSVLWAVPKREKPDRAAKINIWVSTFLVYVFVVMMIFVNGEPIADRAGLSDPVEESSEVYGVQALSGG